MANKATKKKATKDSRVWESDGSKLKKVEGVRMSTRKKDKKGKITGGTEYFGEPKSK